jgi:hypothetical protein
MLRSLGTEARHYVVGSQPTYTLVNEPVFFYERKAKAASLARANDTLPTCVCSEVTTR